jgi:hypothetical protein
VQHAVFTVQCSGIGGVNEVCVEFLRWQHVVGVCGSSGVGLQATVGLNYGEDTASLRVLAESLLACFGLRFRGLFNFFFVVDNELLEAELSSPCSGKQGPLERRLF